MFKEPQEDEIERLQPGDKTALLQVLTTLASNEDYEGAHSAADDALIKYIGDPEITAAYEAIGKWYA